MNNTMNNELINNFNKLFYLELKLFIRQAETRQPFSPHKSI